MLKKLSIDNVALIEHLEIDFWDGLTVLSGETGSGKSIIIDALSFVLGERADKALIKHGKDFAEVSALFEEAEDSAVLLKLAEFGYPAESEILISRRMSVAGKNEIRIQGRTATLSILKEICSDLVDIFGQGQHLALLNEKNQLSVLDSFCLFSGIDLKLKDELAIQLSVVNRELKSFGGSDAERERLIDILKYQINELSDADLSEAEEDELNALHKRMVNAEKIASALGQASQSLNADYGVVSQIHSAVNALRSITAVEDKSDELASRLSVAAIEVSDIAESIDNLFSQTEFNPSEVDRLEARLEKIRQIKRKYGGTVADALKFLSEAQAKYDSLVNSAERIEALNSKKSKILSEMYELALQKSEIRKHTAQELSAKIMKELDELGMKGTGFVVEFNSVPSLEEFSESPSADGFDKVEFLMSANVGEPLKPLSKVISGGEMSRFMLAVKNITALAEKIPTMVFDEIDTGISGNMAQKVAEKLANVSSKDSNGYQCIVITHLPQIVAMADCNLYIEKSQKDGRTVTDVRQLDSDDAKAAEVSRLMGSVGQHALINAKELLEWSRRYKKSNRA